MDDKPGEADKLSEADWLALLLAMEAARRAKAEFRLARHELDKAEADLKDYHSQLSEKYGLRTDDSVDFATGQIVRKGK